MNNEKDQETGENCTPRKSSASKNIPCPVGASGSRSPNIDASLMFPFSEVPASPPSFVSLGELLAAAEDVSNSCFDMALAHEIAVNRDFKLQQKIAKTGLEEEVTKICHKAFWDFLSQQLLADPPEYTQAMVLLKEIKEILLWLLLPHCTRLKNEIHEVLDLDLIEQQAKRGTVDVPSYAQFIIATMSRMCAPARDDDIQGLKKITDTVPLYRGILEILELMKLDMVNFTIARFRPHIQQHSIDYERSKFQEILASLQGLTPPVDGLRFTRLWLQKVHDEVTAEGADAEPSNTVVLTRAYSKILKWKEAEHFPETLHLDHERFLKLRDSLTVMVLTATVVLVTYSSVGTAIQGISEFKETLKSHLQILLANASLCSEEALRAKMETVSLQVALEVRECLERHGYPALNPEQEQALKTSITATAHENHVVRQLIVKRVLEFLELTLQSPSNLKIPPGLSSLQYELAGFAGQYMYLVRHNQSVFIQYYNGILDEWKESKRSE